MDERSRPAVSGPPLAWCLAVSTVVGVLRGVFGWRVRAKPPAVVPPGDRSLVVVCNHTSTLDAFLVADTLWRRMRQWVQPLAKAELFDLPVLGPLVRRAGAIPVARRRDVAREEAYDDAVARLHAGGTILIAPESTVTHDGSLLPLRHGAARLALQAGVDLLVVTHFGAQRGLSPVVRTPQRGVLVTMTVDLVTPLHDEDASALTGRIAAIMLDRSEDLQATYPQSDPDARWWPPYAVPSSPTAVARENLDRYRQSMTEAVAAARERMAAIADEHDVEHRVTLAQERGRFAQERARALAEELASRSRERAETLAGEARERAGTLADQTRERAETMAEHTRHTRERVEGLTSRARHGPR